jgi:hypothetical protein
MKIEIRETPSRGGIMKSFRIKFRGRWFIWAWKKKHG